jgi:hypothetical protein
MGQGSNFSGRSFVGQPVLGQILNLSDNNEKFYQCGDCLNPKVIEKYLALLLIDGSI